MNGPDDATLVALFDSQMASRQLDLMARVKRQENKVFYTIGSSGHEGNALLGCLTRTSDPALLHYRSGAFMAERYRQVEGMAFIRDTCLSFAASSEDPASGGRHKVWGSKPLWVIPQTSTIASHLPKALGMALAIGSGRHAGLPVPADAIVVCSFGDASFNHATAQAALNSCSWSRQQGLPVPILWVCEDNGLGISVPTPAGWVAEAARQRPGIHYVAADGLDLEAGYAAVHQAVELCRARRQPVFLHLRCTRLMGHAGTDFEIEYRDLDELEAAEARDPLLRSAEQVVARGLMSPTAIQARYEALRAQCLAEADRADGRPRLTSRKAIMQSLAPLSADQVAAEARRDSGFRAPLQGPRHLAIQINQALQEVLTKYPQSIVFGEDVARKGGVYTVTKGLWKTFSGRRVFNTLLDETTILGLAQGYASMGYLPIPEIQYLAYFHNACDQIRGEACSLQFFSNNQFRNPMVVRVAGLGYQRGFGGHFHNDNSIAALRDIPGLVIGCPSRGDDAVRMLRTLTALAQVDGRVSLFIEPIALYMTKDLLAPDDGQWCFDFPPPDEALDGFEPRQYQAEASDLLIVTYGNGVPMALRTAAFLKPHGVACQVIDLRWLKPLPLAAVRDQVARCSAVVVFDEGRPEGGVSESLLTDWVEAGLAQRPIHRVTGADCYIPLAAAAELILASEAQLRQACCQAIDRADLYCHP